jgi:hypothetical protein
MPTYYIDSDSFLTANAVYTDAFFETTANDGVYQGCGVYRIQTNGVLGLPVNCPICREACDGALTYATTQEGAYSVQLDLGSDVGDVEVLFSPFTNAQSLSVVYNGVVYTGYFTPGGGSFISEPYLGVDVGGGGCGVESGSPYSLQVYQWDTINDEFDPVGGLPTNVVVNAADVHYEPSGPLTNYVLRFPKNSPTENFAQLTLISPCKGSLAQFAVNCPKPYIGYSSGRKAGNKIDACASSVDIDVYVAQDSRNPKYIIGDFAFADQYGRTLLEDGYYGIKEGAIDDVIQVSNGAIILIDACP